ncbi:MAG: hypothetical protein J7604_24980 [Sporocytophaga sp.]|uniref:hypothetical protein n=1 Tax=Sporocytophaga sp. TaxID=2231183 RepID=UPI001B12B11B|nr:hypothetical protein [Sporocytophaga sp.]MBO9703486.1 hypothetical protein [Sporocytophaga sp.]
MEEGVIDFYKGYEGEPEIDFILKDSSGGIFVVLKLWIRFFDSIMNLIKPNDNGLWEGLLIHYHLHTGWYDMPEWLCDNTYLFYNQLKGIDIVSLSDTEISVLTELMSLVKLSTILKYSLYIKYD